MKVAIIPFPDTPESEGLATYRYFKPKSADITAIYWGNPKLPPDVAKIKIGRGQILDNLDGFDLVVRGPAVHPRQLPSARQVTSTTNIFFEECPTKNIIGVTGTKGKGTTSTLVAKMLEAAGQTVHLGGNIGRPMLDELPKIKPSDWVVLEVSAGQLIDLKHSPRIGVCLMVVPEHLDWHADFEEYISAKQQLFKHQRPADLAVYNALSEGSVEVVAVSPAKKLAYAVPPAGVAAEQRDGAYVEGESIFFAKTRVASVKDVALLGRHNLENICAAIAAVWQIIDGDTAAITSVIKSFKGLEHRLELVRELDGVKYYDDSFATTPETTIAALRAFPDQSKVIILGGSDKGIAFDELADEVGGGGVRAAILIGNTAPKLEGLLRKREFTAITSGLTTMPEMVKAARQLAQPGDIVLLSTACASFGLFKNYKDRGEQFKQVVKVLPDNPQS